MRVNKSLTRIKKEEKAQFWNFVTPLSLLTVQLARIDSESDTWCFILNFLHGALNFKIYLHFFMFLNWDTFCKPASISSRRDHLICTIQKSIFFRTH